MVHNASSSRLRPFFFFALHLEKLEALRKICEVVSSHIRVRRHYVSLAPPLTKSWIRPRVCGETRIPRDMCLGKRDPRGNAIVRSVTFKNL